MKTIIDKAIKTLAKKGEDAKDSSAALKYTQAALNLAHTFATLDNIERGGK